MSPPADTVARFYQAFARRDHATMAACYASTARFSDPVFPDLRGAQIGLMWRMLCERGTDLRVSHGSVTMVGSRARLDWEAWYTFSATGRKVHNVIHAELVLADGLISGHRDEFSFYRWARQALGARGLVLGWTPLLRGAVRKQAARSLERFIATTQAPRGGAT